MRNRYFLNLKQTDTRASDDGCSMYLHCSPDVMDFRFYEANLLGSSNILSNVYASCPISTSEGQIGDITPSGVDKMWKNPLAACDSEVTKENIDGTENGRNQLKFIIIFKSEYFQRKLKILKINDPKIRLHCCNKRILI